MKNIIIGLLLIIVLVLSFYTYKSSSTDTVNEIIYYELGDEVVYSEFSIRINTLQYIDNNLNLEFYNWENLYKDNNRFIVIDVLIENYISDNIYISSNNFSISDDLGYNGTPTTKLDLDHPLNGSVPRQGKLKGQIAFVVHKDSSEWKIRFSIDERFNEVIYLINK